MEWRSWWGRELLVVLGGSEHGCDRSRLKGGSTVVGGLCTETCLEQLGFSTSSSMRDDETAFA